MAARSAPFLSVILRSALENVDEMAAAPAAILSRKQAPRDGLCEEKDRRAGPLRYGAFTTNCTDLYTQTGFVTVPENWDSVLFKVFLLCLLFHLASSK